MSFTRNRGSKWEFYRQEGADELADCAGDFAETVVLFSTARLEILAVARSWTHDVHDMYVRRDVVARISETQLIGDCHSQRVDDATRVFHRLWWHCRSNRHNDSLQQLECDSGTWNTSPCSTVMESRCHGNRRVKDMLRCGRMQIVKYVVQTYLVQTPLLRTALVPNRHRQCVRPGTALLHSSHTLWPAVFLGVVRQS